MNIAKTYLFLVFSFGIIWLYFGPFFYGFEYPIPREFLAVVCFFYLIFCVYSFKYLKIRFFTYPMMIFCFYLIFTPYIHGDMALGILALVFLPVSLIGMIISLFVGVYLDIKEWENKKKIQEEIIKK